MSNGTRSAQPPRQRRGRIVRRILVLGFPTYMVVIEAVLRLGLKVDSSGFLGPTFAATGIGFMMPLTEPKTLRMAQRLENHLKDIGASVILESDQMLIDTAWGLVFVFLLFWAASIYLSVKMTGGASWMFWTSLTLGLLNYLVAIILFVIKENLPEEV